MAPTPLKAEFSHQFGRIITHWAEAEHLLPFLLRASTDTDIFSCYAIMGALQYLQKRDILRAVHDTNVFPERPFRTEVLKFVNRMQAEAALRNHIAHSSWATGRRKDRIKPAVLRSRGDVTVMGADPEERDYSLQEFKRCGDHLARLGEDMRQFARANNLGLPPPSDPLQPALRDE